jgi:DNA mismatch repair protein MLH1
MELTNTEFHFSADGTFSKIGCAKSKRELSLFINDRLVECDSIKRAIERAYSNCFQAIHSNEEGYNCYLSL